MFTLFIILLLFLLLVLLLVYILYYNEEEYENSLVSLRTRSLEKDGFCVLYDPLYSKYKKNSCSPSEMLIHDVLGKLPPDYVFINYVYKINNTSLSTFHRDVTSSKHIFDTIHTVYTLILYNYHGELLSVCPGSNKTYPFVDSKIVNICGNPGTAFLFDSDLLHAGRINNCEYRNVVQYKLCHKDDLHKLQHLHNVNIEKNEKCTHNLYNEIIRKLSYFFEFPINYFAYPLMLKRENTNSFIGFIQSFISLSYYNNT